VPRYYFHVCDGGGFAEDEEGLELADSDAARLEALRGARSLMAEELRQGELNLASFIEVEGEGGEHLFTLTFDDAVEIKAEAVAKPR
jgi:hypothetical protein